MAQLAFNKISKELIVAAGQKIVISDYLTEKIKQVIAIPTNLAELISNIQSNADDEEGNDYSNNENALKNIQSDTVCIQNIALAPNGQYIAVSTSGIKTLIIYSQNIMNSEWEILSIRKSNRASSALTFSPDSKLVLLCDKSGDCFLYDCENYLYAHKWILGHLSSIYDVKFSFDGKYILTADRDEKVRVTNYPNSFEIENYCLGHKEYVCSIELLENHPHILVSLSGDKTFRIWKWEKGIQLAQGELPAPGIKMTVRTMSKSLYELAFLIFQPNDCLSTYMLNVEDYETINIEEKKSICLQSTIITNIDYIQDSLLVSILNNNRLQIELLQTDSDLHLKKFKDLEISIETEFHNQVLPDPEDISCCFKKKFDNVSNYQERKRQRIQAKTNKKKTN